MGFLAETFLVKTIIYYTYCWLEIAAGRMKKSNFNFSKTIHLEILNHNLKTMLQQLKFWLLIIPNKADDGGGAMVSVVFMLQRTWFK